MNYLAHFYLAANDEGLIVGNMLADYKKGKKYLELPEQFQRGVVLHRNIDEYTDTHNEVEKTKVRLRKRYRKYAPVISDVFYDYFLGKNWRDYSDIPLKEFSRNIYKILYRYQEELPDAALLTLGYMSRNDWLYHYSTHYGIEMALKGLTRRANFYTEMYRAIEDLKRDEKLIEEEFRIFFEDIRTYVEGITQTI